MLSKVFSQFTFITMYVWVVYQKHIIAFCTKMVLIILCTVLQRTRSFCKFITFWLLYDKVCANNLVYFFPSLYYNPPSPCIGPCALTWFPMSLFFIFSFINLWVGLVSFPSSSGKSSRYFSLSINTVVIFRSSFDGNYSDFVVHLYIFSDFTNLRKKK